MSRAKQLRAAGARRIYVFATHGLFCDKALEEIGNAVDIHEVVVTDTVPLPVDYDHKSRGKIVQVSIATIISDTIHRMHRKESLRDGNLVVAFDPDGDDSSRKSGYHENG